MLEFHDRQSREDTVTPAATIVKFTLGVLQYYESAFMGFKKKTKIEVVTNCLSYGCRHAQYLGGCFKQVLGAVTSGESPL